MDVYKIALGPGERLKAKLNASWTGANVSLTVWKPPTVHVTGSKANPSLRAAQSVGSGATQQLTYTAKGRGWYYVEVKDASPGFGQYTLTMTKTTPAKR